MRTSRQIFAISFVVALAFFAGGIALGKLLYLAACPLCIIQRMLYLLFALAALSGLVLHRSTPARAFAGVLMLGVAGTGDRKSVV